MLNAVQQFANAIGFAAVPYVITLLLARLLPKHIRAAEPVADATSR